MVSTRRGAAASPSSMLLTVSTLHLTQQDRARDSLPDGTAILTAPSASSVAKGY